MISQRLLPRFKAILEGSGVSGGIAMYYDLIASLPYLPHFERAERSADYASATRSAVAIAQTRTCRPIGPSAVAGPLAARAAARRQPMPPK